MLISDRGDDRDGVMSPGDCQDDLDVTAEITEIPDITRASLSWEHQAKNRKIIFFVKTSHAGGHKG